MLLSALLPGGGQFYTRNFLKGYLYGGALLTLGGLTVWQHQMMRRAYREQRPDSISQRDRRDVMLWWTAAVWVFTIADAYVDANLYGFKEEQRLEVMPQPTGLGVAYRF